MTIDRRRFRRNTTRWRRVSLTVLLVASTGLAIDLFLVDHRPDQQTDNAAAREVIKVASDGAVALLTYSSDHLSQDVANAQPRLTQEYQDYYKRFTEQIVAPTAQRGLTTSARVIRAAVSEMHPDTAVVLVFVDVTTASPDKPQPAQTADSEQVTLKKVGQSWLIAKFDAV